MISIAAQVIHAGTCWLVTSKQPETAAAMSALVRIQIIPHPEHGATLSYQEEPNNGASCSKLECSPEVVQRSSVLQELIATTQGCPGSTMLTLPLHPDAFHAWHAFDENEEPTLQALSQILQVCRAHSTKHKLCSHSSPCVHSKLLCSLSAQSLPDIPACLLCCACRHCAFGVTYIRYCFRYSALPSMALL